MSSSIAKTMDRSTEQDKQTDCPNCRCREQSMHCVALTLLLACNGMHVVLLWTSYS